MLGTHICTHNTIVCECVCMCVRVRGVVNNPLIYLLYRPILISHTLNWFRIQQHITELGALQMTQNNFQNMSCNPKRLVVRMPYLTSTCRPKEICTR